MTAPAPTVDQAVTAALHDLATGSQHEVVARLVAAGCTGRRRSLLCCPIGHWIWRRTGHRVAVTQLGWALEGQHRGRHPESVAQLIADFDRGRLPQLEAVTR